MSLLNPPGPSGPLLAFFLELLSSPRWPPGPGRRGLRLSLTETRPAPQEKRNAEGPEPEAAGVRARPGCTRFLPSQTLHFPDAT